MSRAARCEQCDWTGPERDHWAEEFGDLAKHNRESGHGPIPRTVQVHFDANEAALIHLACRHERNAMLHITRTRRISRAERDEARGYVERFAKIMAACEAIVPGLGS